MVARQPSHAWKLVLLCWKFISSVQFWLSHMDVISNQIMNCAWTSDGSNVVQCQWTRVDQVWWLVCEVSQCIAISSRSRKVCCCIILYWCISHEANDNLWIWLHAWFQELQFLVIVGGSNLVSNALLCFYCFIRSQHIPHNEMRMRGVSFNEWVAFEPYLTFQLHAGPVGT